MRHISFDESTVLNELVKIAHKDGFVKEAQDFPQPRGDIKGIPESIYPADVPRAMDPKRQLGLLQYFLKKYPSMNAVYSGQGLKADQLVADAQKMGFGDELSTLKDPRVISDPGVKKMVDTLMANYNKQLKHLKGLIDRLDADRKPYWENTYKLLSRFAGKKDDMVKSGKDDASKLYDVSGETGEQLVEKAHPGGGTKTEVTHSKTKENLVETIVEQQERDLEVARSVPKGTYAELMDLYNKLHKMGLDEHLDGLKSVIRAVAKVSTANEIIEHTLITLADNLDNLGLKKHANIVDSLLKKKVASPASDQLKKEVLDVLEGLEANRFSDFQKQKAIREWQGTSMPTLKETLTMAEALVRRHGKSFPALYSRVVNVAEKYFPQLEREQRQKEDYGVAGNVTPEPELEPIPKKKTYRRGKDVVEFQNAFNKAVSGTDYEKLALDVDGIEGPKTRAAKQLVIKTVGKLDLGLFRARLQPAPMAPAAPAAPLGRAGIREVKRALYKAIQKKYPKINLYSEQWAGLRKFLSDQAALFSSEDVYGQINNIMSSLTLERMDDLRIKTVGPAMPAARVGR